MSVHYVVTPNSVNNPAGTSLLERFVLLSWSSRLAASKCPKNLSEKSLVHESSHHQSNHRQLNEGFAGAGVRFVVGGQASVAGEPGEGSLDDPPLGQDVEAWLV